jgi:hypothetical protein
MRYVELTNAVRMLRPCAEHDGEISQSVRDTITNERIWLDQLERLANPRVAVMDPLATVTEPRWSLLKESPAFVSVWTGKGNMGRVRQIKVSPQT